MISLLCAISLEIIRSHLNVFLPEDAVSFDTRRAKLVGKSAPPAIRNIAAIWSVLAAVVELRGCPLIAINRSNFLPE